MNKTCGRISQSAAGIFSAEVTSILTMWWTWSHKQPKPSVSSSIWGNVSQANSLWWCSLHCTPVTTGQIHLVHRLKELLKLLGAEILLHYSTLTSVLPVLLPHQLFAPASASFSPPWAERLSQLFQLFRYTTLNKIKADKALFAGSIVIWHWKLKTLKFLSLLENFREVLLVWDRTKL